MLVFDITENFITVTIPFNKNAGTKSAVCEKDDVLLDDGDKKIIALMKADGDMNVSEISRRLGSGMTTVTKRIRRLKEKGIIGRKGSKKKGQWIVNVK